MLDWGFSKLLLIGIVALVVLGPEKLPQLARALGQLIGKVQRYANAAKYHIHHALATEDLAQFKTSLTHSVQEVRKSVQGIQTALQMPGASMAQTGVDDAGAWPVSVHPNPVPLLKSGKRQRWQSRARVAMPRASQTRTPMRRHVLSGAARLARGSVANASPKALLK